MEFATTERRPLAKEDGQTVIADSALRDKVVIVKRGKIRREFAHQAHVIPREYMVKPHRD
jgi:hypothetical protein